MKHTFIADRHQRQPANINLLIMAVAVIAFMMSMATFVLLTGSIRFVGDGNYAFLAFLMTVIVMGGFAMGSAVKAIGINMRARDHQSTP
jgi:hypothetical protein